MLSPLVFYSLDLKKKVFTCIFGSYHYFCPQIILRELNRSSHDLIGPSRTISLSLSFFSRCVFVHEREIVHMCYLYNTFQICFKTRFCAQVRML